MKLYFTGADAFEDPQASSLLSLGGFPSSSPVPAEGIDKIFGGISQTDLRKGSVLVKAVVIKNETATDPVTGATIHYLNNSQFPVANYRIAIVTLPVDSCGKQIMESIPNTFARPVDAVFVDARGVSNQLTFPDIAIDEYMGIWIERSINTAKGNEALSCDFLLAAHDVTPVNNIQTVTIISGPATAGHYFTVDTIFNRYVVWFSDGVAPIPDIASSYELLIVTHVGAGETPATLAAKINTKLQEIPEVRGEITSTVLTSVVTITNLSPGAIATPIVSDSNIVLATTVVGLSDNLEKIEDVELIITY